jgi:hypothetical protein
MQYCTSVWLFSAGTVSINQQLVTQLPYGLLKYKYELACSSDHWNYLNMRYVSRVQFTVATDRASMQIIYRGSECTRKLPVKNDGKIWSNT